VLALALASSAACTDLKTDQDDLVGGDLIGDDRLLLDGNADRDRQVGPGSDGPDAGPGDGPASDADAGGDAAARPEQEPANSDPATAPVLQLGQAYAGVLDPAGDADYYRFQAIAGELYRVSLSDLGSGFTADPSVAGGGAAAVVAVWSGDPAQGPLTLTRLLVQDAGSTSPLTREFFIRGGGPYFIQVTTVDGTSYFNPYANTTMASGGPDFTYTLRLERETPLPSVIGTLDMSATGDFHDGSVQLFRVTARSQGYLAALLTAQTVASWEPVVSLWDHDSLTEVAGGLVGETVRTSTLINFAHVTDPWVVADTFITRSGPSPYTLALSAQPESPGATCITAPNLDQSGVAYNADSRRLIQDWLAADPGAPFSSACISSPPDGQRPQTTRRAFRINAEVGARVAARLDPAFDGSLVLVADCTNPGPTCLAGIDQPGYRREAVLYDNSSGGIAALTLLVSTTGRAGGYFSLLADPQADCATTADCGEPGPGSLGDLCQDLRCRDPSGGSGNRYPATVNGSAPVAIPDGAAGCSAEGGAVQSSILVAGPAGVITGVHLYVDVAHIAPSELAIKLRHPDGSTEVEVKRPQGSTYGVGGLVTVFPDETALPDGVSFELFTGLSPVGQWTLSVSDGCAGNTGSLVKAVLILEIR
jgi:subtilisin-like proprotein convertase family protein